MNKAKHILPTLLLSVSALFTATAQEVVTIDHSLGTSVEFDETEGMTIRYDSLLNDWKVKMYLYVDSTCHGTDIDPTFPDSVYIDRLQRIPAVMELPYNHIVRQYIDRYTKRLRKSVSVMLGAGNFYFPIFEAELERYGLPLELKYLPVIESALKPKAVSPAGAGGLWQFMVGTGKQYGLKVNSVIDERCDPIKSSDAAARYLRDLYRIYHDWALVLAAYNCGPGNVNRAIHRAGSRDYWQIYPYLPKETRGYVPAFIAATYAMTYYCEHGICPMRSRFPIATDTIIINRDISMRQISEVVGISLDVLKSLNPQYRTDRIPGKSQPCILRMPDDMLHAFLDYGDDVYKYRASELLARRAEVSVRGERNTRQTAQTTTGPATQAQSAMPGSNMPSIADTEPVVPAENQPATPPTQPQRAVAIGEVTEVPIAESAPETIVPGTGEENGVTTIVEDEEGSLQPVQTNTRRMSSSAGNAQQQQAQPARPVQQQQTRPANTNNNNRPRQQTQPTQQHQTWSTNTNNNRSRQQTQPAQQQQQTQSGSNTRNRTRQQAQPAQQQQQTQSGSNTRNRSRQQAQPAQQQTQSGSNTRNRSRQQAQPAQQQQQTQSGSNTRNRSRQQTQPAQQQQQTQSQSNTRNRNRSRQQAQPAQQQQSQSGSNTHNRNRSHQQTQPAQQQTQSGSNTRNRNRSTSTQQSNTRNQSTATPQPRSNRGTRPAGSGKAGSGRK